MRRLFPRFQVATTSIALLAFAFVLTARASAGTVTISSPSSGGTVSQSFHVVASATASSTIDATQVYLDGNKVYQVSGSKVDTYLTASAGDHRLTVKGWVNSSSFQSTIYIKVTSTPDGSGGSTSTAAQYSNIDQMSGWNSCDSCAGENGVGPSLKHTLTQGVSSPSMDGKSAKFSIFPTTSYANALWWHPLTQQPNARHLVYDLYFYLTDASAPQSLEFDVNQAVNGKWYIFGTECSMKSSKTWKVWDYYKHWVDTGISCTGFSAYTWHHLTWEFERTTDNKTHFIAMTLDGTKHYVNRYYNPKPSSTPKLTVSYQMDGNSSGTDYSTWLDKVTLKYW